MHSIDATGTPAPSVRQHVRTLGNNAQSDCASPANVPEVRVQSVNADHETPQTQIKLSEGLIIKCDQVLIT